MAVRFSAVIARSHGIGVARYTAPSEKTCIPLFAVVAPPPKIYPFIFILSYLHRKKVEKCLTDGFYFLEARLSNGYLQYLISWLFTVKTFIEIEPIKESTGSNSLNFRPKPPIDPANLAQNVNV